MSNSSLATIQVPAHKNGQFSRDGNKIEIITIHHMAGKYTAEQCGKSFQKKDRKAATHYGIGYNGEIAQYVDESVAARANGKNPAGVNASQRAVTIETSNSSTDDNWLVSDAALQSLIRLVADIAIRNGLYPLVKSKPKDSDGTILDPGPGESKDKYNSTIIKEREGNITWHKLYRSPTTICPGPYLLSKMDEIIEKANKLIESGELGLVQNTGSKSIFIGDFRCKQLQHYLNKFDPGRKDIGFIVEDAAEFTWFNTSVMTQLSKYSSANLNTVFMLGFIDCVYSCVWPDNFNIEEIALQYVKKINELVKQNSGSIFYVCPISPIEAGYPFARFPGGLISKALLEQNIEIFNNTLKEKCNAKIIDSDHYLTKTSFVTRDGIRYTLDTCKNLFNYISTELKITGAYGTLTKTRTTFADAPDPTDPSYINWKTQSDGEIYNKCSEIENGSVLPNCVGYAWGRFMEILGDTPTLSTNSPRYWWDHDDGYERGQEPKPGAVIVWKRVVNNVEEDGHVAIVEKVNADGTIITSESAFKSWETVYDNKDPGKGHFFVTTRIYDADAKNWRKASNGSAINSWIDNGYIFQGFIYNPVNLLTGVNADKSLVTSSNNWFKHRSVDPNCPEMHNNAKYIWNYLGTQGWTLNAVAGMLGNIEAESRMNPGIWQSTNEASARALDPDTRTESDRTKYKSHGYGLTQWTPFWKYTDWCLKNGYEKSDMDSALKRIEWEVSENKQWNLNDKSIKTFKEFTQSTLPAYDLAGVFVSNYEVCKGFSTFEVQDYRGKNAEYWYEYLSQYSPQSGQPIKLTNLKTDKVLPTSLKASFVARSASFAEYTITESETKKELVRIPLELKQKNKESVTEGTTSKNGLDANSTETEKAKKSTEIALIEINCDNLNPNTAYELSVALSSDANDPKKDRLSASIDFVTPQDYPDNCKKVELALSNFEGKSPEDVRFSFSVTEPDYIGFWGSKNDCGYDISLLINGIFIETIEHSELSLSWHSFKIKDKFNYSCNLTDTIQIGVRTWVKHDNGKKIYNKKGIKTTDPINLLQQANIMGRSCLKYLTILD